jgi:hypothetical protein
MDVWQSGKSFKDVLKSSGELTKVLQGSEFDSLFDVNKSIRNVDYIFERVGLT